jgi:hypothetical protein
MVTAAGGHLFVDDATVALYRQHEDNLVGATSSALYRALGALRRGPGPFVQILCAHLDALIAQPELISGPAHAIATDLRHALASGLFLKLAALRQPGLRRQRFSETLMFWLWLLVARIHV